MHCRLKSLRNNSSNPLHPSTGNGLRSLTSGFVFRIKSKYQKYWQVLKDFAHYRTSPALVSKYAIVIKLRLINYIFKVFRSNFQSSLPSIPGN